MLKEGSVTGGGGAGGVGTVLPLTESEVYSQVHVEVHVCSTACMYMCLSHACTGTC